MTLAGMAVLCYPEQEPANKLAQAKAKAVKAGVAKPFPLIDMSDFLPPSMDVSDLCHITVYSLILPCPFALKDTTAASDEADSSSAKKKRLDMIRWIAAFQAYALAAEAAEVSLLRFRSCTFVSLVAIS